MGHVGDLKNRLQAFDQALGSLVSHLLSLEFQLRVFLYERDEQPGERWPVGTDPLAFSKGDLVPVNPFTNWDELSKLVTKYNHAVGDRHPELRVDEDLIDVRNAIAHGRLATTDPMRPLRLVKFEKPQQGASTTRVEFSIDATPRWLEQQRQRVGDEFSKVLRATEVLRAGAVR